MQTHRFIFGFMFLFLMGNQVCSTDELLLTLEVNHSPCSEILRGQLIEEHLVFKRQELEKCHVFPPTNAESINLKSIPNSDYSFDQESLKVSMTVPVQWLKSQQYEANLSPAIANQGDSIFGIGMNYDLFGHKCSHHGHIAGLPEVLIFSPFGLGTASFLIKKDNGKAEIVRIESNWIFDFPQKMIRLQLGDGTTRSPHWGCASRFTGIQLSTNFASQPYFIPYPQPSIRGEVSVPTALDILANNSPLHHQKIYSGSYEITNIPTVTGAGVMNLQTVDILGNKQVINIPYYTSSDLLKPGLSDYSYELGFLRRSYGIKSNHYSYPALVGTHRVGISDVYTIAGHGELSRHHMLASLEQTFLISPYINTNIAGAISHSSGRQGWLASISVNRQADPISFGHRLMFASRSFRDISSYRSHHLSSKTALQNFISWCHDGLGTFTTSFTSTSAHKKGRFGLLTFNYQKQFSGYFNLTFSFGRQFGSNKHTFGSVGLYFSLGGSKSAFLSSSHKEDCHHSTVGFQKSIPGDLGTGYRARVTHDPHHQLEYEAEVRHSHEQGRIEARSFLNNERYYHQLNLSGGFLYLDGKPFLTPKINDSVALVQTRSGKGVRVYKNSQRVGTTNNDGDILLANIKSYSNYEIRLEEQDIPIDGHLETNKQNIYSPMPGAFSVKFSNTQIKSQIVKVVKEDQTPLDVGTMITWSDNQSTIVGNDGEINILLSHTHTGEELEGDVIDNNLKCKIKFENKTLEGESSEDAVLVCKTAHVRSIDNTQS